MSGPPKAKSLAGYFLLCCIGLFIAARPDPVLCSTQRDIYAQGRQYMREGKWTEALERFRLLENDYSLLGDYVLFDAAYCYEKSGAVEESVTYLRKILDNYNESPLYRKAYGRMLEIGKGRDATAALTDLDLYLREFPQDSKILWEKAALLEKLGRTDEALNLRKELFLAGSPYTLKAYEALKNGNCPPSYDEIKKALNCLADKGNYGLSLSLLEGIAVQDEEGKYLLGRAYFRLRRYRDAIRMLTGVSLKDGKYLLALSLLRANEKGAFYRLVEEQTKGGGKGLFSLHMIAADQKRREGNISEAGAILRSLPALYPEKKEEVAWSQAWLAVRQKRFSEAEKLLEALASSNSDKRDKYLFWMGKVKSYHDRNGDAWFSRIKDRNSYYFFRAGKNETGALPDGGEGLKKEKSPALPEEMNRKFLRITELSSLKMNAEARTESRLLMNSVAEPHVSFFARLLVEIEDFFTLVKLGLKHNYQRLKYPLAFRDTVVKHARLQKIDPFLVLAVMREESHFQCDAVSGAGALGVMQLMPATARRMGEVKRTEELFEAEKNIMLGTSYLSRLLNRYKSPHYALAAYNAGEHNVEKWLAAGYRDEDEFAEDIPFSETKNYVFRVLKTYGIMKELYGGEIGS